jgi:SAC3/GANP family
MMAPSYPSAYFMCSEAECQERQSSGEISIFECQWPPPCIAATSTKPQSSLALAAAAKNTHSGSKQQQVQRQYRRIVNPRFAMTKYRRSAAGLEHKNPPRTIQQLDCCLSQLEYILCHQRQPPSDTTTYTSFQHDPFPRQTLTGTVSFVEDRIRAIQVDMVVSQQASASLQYRIVKCHTLILYLLSNVKSYESRFGQQALSASLTNYWSGAHRDDDDNGENHEHDDEILCFMALHQLSQYCQAHHYKSSSNDTNCEALSLILTYYRRNVNTRQRRLHHFPKFRWALYLVELALMGRPQSLLRQLVECKNWDKDSSSNNSSSFSILCRCVMAPAIDKLRLQALDQYNTTFMKEEKVLLDELARLLFVSTAAEAKDYCVTVAGLTLHVNGDAIVFKVGPLKQQSSESPLNVRRQDAFCFGELGHWTTAMTPSSSEYNERTAWDDVASNEAEPSKTSFLTGATLDSEGVLVPPPSLLYQILQSKSPGLN